MFQKSNIPPPLHPPGPLPMKHAILAALLSTFAIPSALWAADCYEECVPRWSAPSPTLNNKCFHTTGVPFATCDCERAYTSPHVLGYGGKGCCYGYQQRPPCLCPLGCFWNPYKCWSPRYCPTQAEVPHRFSAAYGYGQGSDCHECDSSLGVACQGWENLGHIPNDSAAAVVEALGTPAIPGLPPPSL